jgi:hypothetical protein
MHRERPKAQNANAARAEGGAAKRSFRSKDEQQSNKRSVIRRQGRCRHCDMRFDMPATGRRKWFCSENCRVASAREKAVFERAGCIAPGVTKPTQQVTENIAPVGTKKQTHSCQFSVPIDLLGRGYKWPGAPSLDPDTLQKIAWCEIGGAP